jgi:uncharacterized protein (TIGR02145 family)
MKKETTNLMHHKKTVRETRAGSGLNLLKGLTLMLVMALVIMGCDSIVDQQKEADSGIATSDISGVLSVDVSTIECIDPDAGEYHVVSESKTVEWGNRDPFEKTVDIEYYNTLTEFVLRVKSTEAIADVLVDDESIKNFDGTIEAGDWQEFTFDLDEGDTQSFSLKVAGSGPPAEFEVDYEILGECDEVDTGRDTTTEVVEVTSLTGRIWMDRNLGATRAAESSTDAQAYGDLFQWGRAADGHQIINRFVGDGKTTSGTTLTLSNSDQPGHGSFILSNVEANWDWRSPQNSNLWQGVDGNNNPCPVGFRLPTEDEWEAEIDSWGEGNQNAAGAFNSPLKLPVAGLRELITGSLSNVGLFSAYWSGTVSGTFARNLGFISSDAYMSSNRRALGFSVRCLKEDTSD